MPEYSPFIAVRPAERAGLLVVFVAVAVIVAALNIGSGRGSLVVILIAFLTHLLALAYPILYYRRHWGWLHPLVFTVLWFGLFRETVPHIGVYSLGLQYNAAMPAASADRLNYVVAKTLLLSTLGLLALYSGFFVAGRFAAPLVLFPRPRAVPTKAILIAIVSLVALIMLARNAGGFSALMMQRGLPENQRAQIAAGGEHWQFLAGVLMPACLLWLGQRPTAWREVRFVLIFTMALLINFVATGSRSESILPLAMAIVIWSIWRQRVPWLVAGTFAAAAILFIGLAGDFRVATRGARSFEQIQLNSSIVAGLEKGFGVFAAYSSAEDGTYGIVGNVPDRIPLLYGESYLSIPFAFLPRALLPFDKPRSGDKMTATYIFGNPLSAVPPGNIGEAYWNFHVPGIVFVMLVHGVFLRWVASVYYLNRNEGWATVAYVHTLFLFQPNSTAFYGWAQALVPLLILAIFFCGAPRLGRRHDGGVLQA